MIGKAIMGVLCSLSLLFGIGVGDATPSNATGSIRDIEQASEIKTEKQVFDLTVDSNAVQGQREERSNTEIVAELNRKVEEGMLTISINLRPVFENGSSQGHLRIINEKCNKYPQVVEIYRTDTDSLIYQSKVIPVGSRVDNDVLLVDLDAGEYPCVAYISSVNADGEVIGKAGAELLLVVEN